MKTPICDFCKKYAVNQPIRLHMPAHKGKNLLGFETLDITEIVGADSLYEANGIIKESEENAKILFNTAKTFYSTEGSSQVIKAMVYLAKVYKNVKKPYILSMRNAHKSFINACAVLDVDISYFDYETLISAKVSAKEVEEKLLSQEIKPIAVYLTTPDYLGNRVNVEEISKVCKKHGVLLLVDNAHGSYLKFVEKPSHPIDLGADLCADSAHKTLPCLTGGAYLHVSKTANSYFLQETKNALAIFGSTSPSYLILQSLDNLNKFIFENKNLFLQTEIEVKKLKNKLKKLGFIDISCEPFKITIDCKKYGYYGQEINEILEKNNIFVEFFDRDFLVMLFSTSTTQEEFIAVEKAFSSIEKRQEILETLPKIPRFEKVLTPNEAMNKPKVLVNIKQAEGKILAGASCSCPPAVLIVSLGERITQDAIKLFEYYNIKEVLVVE